VWFHLRHPVNAWPGSVYLGESLIGRGLLPDLLEIPRLWITGWHPVVNGWAQRILEAKADMHWVVGMNEGFWVGNALRRAAPRVPMHVSVQDDQERGVYGRSRRYFWMAPLAHRQVQGLLRAASGVDVISEAMRDYYRGKLGLETVVSCRFVARLPEVRPHIPSSEVVRVGHIGSLYTWGPFRDFLDALRRWCAARGRRFEVVLIGFEGPLLDRARAWGGDSIVAPGHLDEEEAIPILSGCDFVYAMYPFSRGAEVFRTTSFPTKLCSYMMAQRPILAHAPSSSTLAAFVKDTSTGVVSPTRNVQALLGKIDEVMGLAVGRERFEEARKRYFGRSNVSALQHCLDGGQ